MSKHKITVLGTEHGALSFAHDGKGDQGYCEAGETVRLNWQPSAGWGLQEAHYITATDPDTAVAIDLSQREFTMPASNIVIGGTFKRFVVQDWTTNAPSQAGKVLGIDENGNLIPSEGGGGGAMQSGDIYHRPTLTSDDAGTMYFDTTLNKLVVWTGVEWVDANGTHAATPLSFSGTGSIGFWQDTTESLGGDELTINFEYSIDGGVTWTPYTVNTGTTSTIATLVQIPAGGVLLLRGTNEKINSFSFDTEQGCIVRCVIDGTIGAKGDLTALLNGIGGDVALPDSAFIQLFKDSAGLISAPALPSTTINYYCYRELFYGSSITEAPELPATTLEVACYYEMFYDCSMMTKAPSVLPADKAVQESYQYMFYGCSSLSNSPFLAATDFTGSCLNALFYNCSSVRSHHVASLNTSSHVFKNNSSCEVLAIDADTPPTILSETITGLKADCIIYVPAASVDAYKAAQYWSARSAYIQAMP